MKKSNRLILLVGIVLAAVAFVAIVFLFSSGSGGQGNTPTVPTELPTVIASVDIPLGTQIRNDMLTVKTVAVTDRAADAVQEPSPVVGQIVRTNVVAGAQITRSMFAVSSVGLAPGPLLNKGLRAQSVQVDQVTGVGTLINVGDRVDAVVGFGGGGCGASFPVVTVDPTTDTVTPVAGLSSITVKLLLQNMQVVSTLLPPVTTTTETTNGASPAPGTGTTLNGQQEIVVLAVTAQQSEIIKYAQTDGCISLVLRSPKDFIDDAGNTTEPPPDPTTGIILKTLVDEYGVLPPQVVEAILPKR
ncbi:MAG TPA: Flp pilus assembly protein CpaB [Patescibacteria group bacterium]|nr:Flp pilus assembly protein CpaB [Patescibacteria group bacterium]